MTLYSLAQDMPLLTHRGQFPLRVLPISLLLGFILLTTVFNHVRMRPHMTPSLFLCLARSPIAIFLLSPLILSPVLQFLTAPLRPTDALIDRIERERL